MYIDIILAIVFLVASIKGYQKGFFVSLFSFVGYLLGMFLAIKCSAMLAEKMKAHTGQMEKWYPFLSFVLIMAGTFVIAGLIGKIFKKSAESVMLGWLDRLGGVVLYMCIFGIITSFILFFLCKVGVISNQTSHKSILYPLIEPIAPNLMNFSGKIIPACKGVIDQLNHYFDK